MAYVPPVSFATVRAPADPLADRRLAHAQPRRQVGVGLLVQDVRPNRLTLRLGQLVQRHQQRVGRVARVDQRLDPLERRVAHRHALDSEPLARPPFDRAALPRPVQHVARDPQQPPERALALVPEAARAGDRGRERLSGQVRRQLGIARPSRQVPGHDRLVPAVEDRERLGVPAAGAAQQLTVGGGRMRIHLPLITTTRRACDSRPHAARRGWEHVRSCAFSAQPP
jgi:hypothetical protein